MRAGAEETNALSVGHNEAGRIARLWSYTMVVSGRRCWAEGVEGAQQIGNLMKQQEFGVACMHRCSAIGRDDYDDGHRSQTL